jgi:tyrosine-protein phosphatase YwqE
LINKLLGFERPERKKKKQISKDLANLENVMVDMHSHLLPGIDDGVESYDEAIEVIKEMVFAGYRKIITTPHIMSDGYPNTSKDILSKFKTLKKNVDGLEIDVDLGVAAEYYVDAHFEELLDKDDILTIDEDKILIEFSYLNKPLNYKKILIKLFEKGYRPILAHPERYVFLQNNKNGFNELKEMGVEFQLNMFSLVGAYDRASQHHGRRLIQKGMIDYIGTDIHRSHQLKLFKRSLGSRHLNQLINQNQLKNLFLTL